MPLLNNNLYHCSYLQHQNGSNPVRTINVKICYFTMTTIQNRQTPEIMSEVEVGSQWQLFIQEAVF